MDVALALTHHDLQGRLYGQLGDMLPVIAGVFRGLAVFASAATDEGALDLLASAGSHLTHGALKGWARPVEPGGRCAFREALSSSTMLTRRIRRM